MSTVEEIVRTQRAHPEARDADVRDPLAGDAAMIGMPAFLASSLAMALTLIGYVPYSAVAAPVPILTIGGIVQLIAANRAAKRGQHLLAGAFAIFSVFWLSYAFTTLGLANKWFGMGPDGTIPTQEMFLICWFTMLVLFTLPTLRMPIAITGLFAMIDVALLMVLLGTLNHGHNMSIGLGRALQFIGGVTMFGFIAIGAYLLVHVTSVATGGKGLPLGRPILRR
ncbi:hypothetical protein ALI144C_32395 [Actinosynnema sp. ALI-1.44]|uniref:GPR1/FUN34/YaaH family transporter n=1 Tax=Actinosynnema sp. ALI-1.44 TaxID=1933779 RepID=UPI00097C4196|nr:GPR1/FUN34/YaaH family transporter [Actinosynnema sp. ALI-1.44]ONI78079.1 hypothetical protein ALI144C_32395 [Actinosynnema sp. ALI-1.44]